MEKFKSVIDLLAKSAIKEHKTDDFFDVCRQLKDNIFIKMLSGTCSKAEAENLRDYIISKERSIQNALQRV